MWFVFVFVWCGFWFFGLTICVLFVIIISVLPKWRNGRRIRLKIVRETVGVRVPPSAPVGHLRFSGGAVYRIFRQHLLIDFLFMIGTKKLIYLK